LDYVPHLELVKVGKDRRKKKRLKGDMDTMRGYGEDKYGGGDFNETRAWWDTQTPTNWKGIS
jgi:hypothetical protein